MKLDKSNKLNQYELEILNYFNEMCESFPSISRETLICETATRLNILDKKNKHYHRAFLQLYNKGYFQKEDRISV